MKSKLILGSHRAHNLDDLVEFDNLSHNKVKQKLIFRFDHFQPVADPPAVMPGLIAAVELFSVHLTTGYDILQNGDDVMTGLDRSRFSLETHIKNPTSPTSAMTSILSVANVTKNDDADYECIVTNPYGKTSHRIRLLVQGTTIEFLKEAKLQNLGLFTCLIN